MHVNLRRNLVPILIAAIATLPGIYLRLTAIPLFDWLPAYGWGTRLLLAQGGQYAYLVAILSGLSVLGASFLLLWACDAIQEDISQTLALAIVALIAVLPEYAVDMYITWTAGHRPEYAHYAIANMTGANRLIIGAAWLVVVGIYWLKTRKAVRIEAERRTELVFLGMATLYAFFIVIKWALWGWGLSWYDGLVFFAIYAWYIRVAGRRPCVECDAEGPAELLLSLPKIPRRLATAAMFLLAAGAVALNAQQFSEGLLTTGALLHINKATLIQWLAPLASEAPEFTVAIMFTLRKRAGLALGSLLSSNLNQWTLLVGMIPWVYAASHGSFSHAMPMDAHQMQEILLTAAQSLLGIVLLTTLRLTIGQVLLIFGLFVGQLLIPALLDLYPNWAPFGLHAARIHPIFSAIYIAVALAILIATPGRLRGLWEGAQPDTFCSLPSAVEDEDYAVAMK
jgi:cation:H+ antiporter